MAPHTSLLRRTDIRLLYLQPTDHEIVCTMYTVDLDSQPEYRALSYEWGSSTPTVTIQCNDSNFEVTTNLAAALHRLRKLDGPKIFWIDALCINQKDLEERNQQVAQMGRIYSQAESVIVWLGPAADQSDAAFAYLQTFSRIGGRTGWDAPDHINLAVFLLLQRTYWTRIWILQEVVLARTILVICGEDCLDWTWLERILLPIHDQSNPTKKGDGPLLSEAKAKAIMHSPGGNVIMSKVFRPLGKEKSDQGLTTSSLLFITRGMKSTDPRDKIYGFQGLLEQDADGGAIVVDYAIGLPELYAEVLRKLFQKTQEPRDMIFLRRSLGLSGIQDDVSLRMLRSTQVDTECTNEEVWSRFLREETRTLGMFDHDQTEGYIELLRDAAPNDAVPADSKSLTE